MKDIRKEIKSSQIKFEIKSMLQKQQTEPSTGFTTYRSGITTDAELTQPTTERSNYKFPLQLRKFSINSTIEKSNIQNLINPLLKKRNTDFSTKLLLNSPSSLSQSINQHPFNIISPISNFNESGNQQGKMMKSQNNTANENGEKQMMNLTKNNYHEYLLNDTEDSRLNSMQLNGNQLLTNKMKLNLVGKVIPNGTNEERGVKTERKFDKTINKQTLENKYLFQTRRQRNNSYNENPKYEKYQNYLLAYSQSKITHPKINPDYFTLAQQVCKNQNLMHSDKTSHTVSAAESPRRKSKNNLKDVVDTYKQTVQKLVDDRKELSRTKNAVQSNGNIVSINRASNFNSPVNSQMIIPASSYGNIQNLVSYGNIQNLVSYGNIQSQFSQGNIHNQQSQGNINQLTLNHPKQVSYGFIKSSSNTPLTSNQNTPKDSIRNGNIARFNYEDNPVPSEDIHHFPIANFDRIVHTQSDSYSLQNTPRKRNYTNSQGRIQQKQSLLKREQFSSLFEEVNKDHSLSNFSKMQSLLSSQKIDYKQDNMIINKIKQEKRKEFSNIQKLSQHLIEAGLVNSQEQDLLDTKLKIQRFFLKKDISIEHKKESFNRLMKEFNPQNQKYSTSNSTEITQMLMSMKPFYFDKSNNPIVKSFSNNEKKNETQDKLQQKASQTSSSFGMQDLTSQVTTFYKTKTNQLNKLKRTTSSQHVKFQSNPKITPRENLKTRK